MLPSLVVTSSVEQEPAQYKSFQNIFQLSESEKSLDGAQVRMSQVPMSTTDYGCNSQLQP